LEANAVIPHHAVLDDPDGNTAGHINACLPEHGFGLGQETLPEAVIVPGPGHDLAPQPSLSRFSFQCQYHGLNLLTSWSAIQ
jgi:hypothetical protein